MSEQLPYEELLAQKLAELPLPDENMAWEDMRRRLDEDKKRRIFPFWLNGCLGWGLIGLLVTGLGWWIFRPLQWVRSGNETREVIAADNKEKRSTADTVNFPGINENNVEQEPQADSINRNDKNRTANEDDHLPLNKKEEEQRTGPGEKDRRKPGIIEPGKQPAPGENGNRLNPAGDHNVTRNRKRKKTIVKHDDPQKKEEIRQKKEDTDGLPEISYDNEQQRRERKDSLDRVSKAYEPQKDSLKSDTGQVSKTNGPDRDSTVQKRIDSVNHLKEIKDTAADQPPKSKKKPLTYSAGTGIYQLLPVNGQSLTPYNSLGRKGTLMDYIPSLIFRVNKEEKWFIHSEFRYGAPQQTKDIVYKFSTDTNHSTQKVTNTSTRVKKTYYHQLPLTFNYYILPGMSLGAGVSWNRFNSAISERDIIIRDLQTGLDTAFGPTEILRTRRADSNFVKSYWQAVIEASYKRNKFSAGLRYAFGLQPFIRFTLPGGLQQEEKNSSLQLFIRYEFWRSKRKQ
jgi:hypothetical protein